MGGFFLFTHLVISTYMFFLSLYAIIKMLRARRIYEF